MQAKDFNPGDKFKLLSRGYYADKQPVIYTVDQVSADSIYFHHDDTDYVLTDVNMTFYGAKLVVVSRAKKLDNVRPLITKRKETIYAELTDETASKRFYAVFVTVDNITHRHYVHIWNGGARCCCQGWHRYGRCKHLNAALACEAVGKRAA